MDFIESWAISIVLLPAGTYSSSLGQNLRILPTLKIVEVIINFQYQMTK